MHADQQCRTISCPEVNNHVDPQFFGKHASHAGLKTVSRPALSRILEREKMKHR